MRMRKESGFEGPLPSSIKPDGFHCYRRGGCDREALCEGEGECLGVDPSPANALKYDRFEEVADIQCLGVRPSTANSLNRNRFDEITAIVRTLRYGELIEF